jgi:hypothetical protein
MSVTIYERIFIDPCMLVSPVFRSLPIFFAKMMVREHKTLLFEVVLW